MRAELCLSFCGLEMFVEGLCFFVLFRSLVCLFAFVEVLRVLLCFFLWFGLFVEDACFDLFLWLGLFALCLLFFMFLLRVCLVRNARVGS